MISYPKACNKTSFNLLKCALCRDDIKDNSYVYQSGLNFGIICDDCNVKFTKSDIDLMTNMFIAYGGYFGKIKAADFSMDDIMNDLARDLDSRKGNINLKELNIKMLHKALLHGVTPQQFIAKLKKFLSL